MRRLVLVIATTAGVLLPSDPGHARVEGPWCAGYSIGSGTWMEDCSMRTFEMCRMEVIAGNRGVCSPNPRWQAYATDRVPTRRARKRAR